MSRKEEELRAQQEKEAYRETQKSVYARIYQEQDEMPEDYEEAFREEEEPEERMGKRKLILITVLLMLVALVGAALAAHAILVHRPDLPEETAPAVVEPQEVTDRREDVYTFLLVGRDSAGGGNTDTIMVGSLDGKNGTLDILSIYRDTLVDVPWEIKKINSVSHRLHSGLLHRHGNGRCGQDRGRPGGRGLRCSLQYALRRPLSGSAHPL